MSFVISLYLNKIVIKTRLICNHTSKLLYFVEFAWLTFENPHSFNALNHELNKAQQS